MSMLSIDSNPPMLCRSSIIRLHNDDDVDIQECPDGDDYHVVYLSRVPGTLRAMLRFWFLRLLGLCGRAC